MCEDILIDPPMAIDELEVAAEMRAEGMEVEPHGQTLIRPMDLGAIIRGIASNYSIRPDQVPELLEGYLAAGKEVKGLICASGYMYKAPKAIKPRVLTGALQAVHGVMADHQDHTLAEIAVQAGISEAGASARLRDLRAAGYNIISRPAEGSKLWLYRMEA